jgi:hypothetical protein
LNHSTHWIPSLHGWESFRVATRVISGLDIIKAIPGFRIDPGIKEAEGRLALGDQEVVQKGDDARYGLPKDELDLGTVKVKRTGAEQLVPLMFWTNPPITTWKFSAWADISGYARPERLSTRELRGISNVNNKDALIEIRMHAANALDVRRNGRILVRGARKVVWEPTTREAGRNLGVHSSGAANSRDEGTL